jgi:hypothetical protein
MRGCLAHGKRATFGRIHEESARKWYVLGKPILEYGLRACSARATESQPRMVPCCHDAPLNAAVEEYEGEEQGKRKWKSNRQRLPIFPDHLLYASSTI